MSRTKGRGRVEDRLGRRLELLTEVLETSEGAPGRLPADLVEQISSTLEQAQSRLGHGTSHTVVALSGATGSGKSSLFNVLVGAEVAAVGIRRPTTSTTQAAVFSTDGAVGDEAAALLDWLAVGRRHRLAGHRAAAASDRSAGHRDLRDVLG